MFFYCTKKFFYEDNLLQIFFVFIKGLALRVAPRHYHILKKIFNEKFLFSQ